MKPGIHPEYEVAKITCACGRVTETRSTVGEIHVEICSHCHPFFTGRQKLVDTAGRVERFKAKYGERAKAGAAKAAEPAEAEEAPASEAEAPAAEAEPSVTEAEAVEAPEAEAEETPEAEVAEAAEAEADAEETVAEAETSGDDETEEEPVTAE